MMTPVLSDPYLSFVSFYAWLYGKIKDNFSFRLRGMNFLLRQTRKDRVISVQGRQLYFNHKVASSYSRMVCGQWNEIETHLFFNRLLEMAPRMVTFVEVGANVGEMIVDFANHPKVHNTVAFEPLPECISALNKTIELNGLTEVRLIGKACSDVEGSSMINLGQDLGSSALKSNFHHTDAQIKVLKTTLDSESFQAQKEILLLIDAEGEELNIMRGGTKLIKENHPLIVFEYNHVSRLAFSLEDVRSLMGDSYTIYRLRGDGNLDSDFSRTWNCVAVPVSGIWHSLSKPFIT